MGILGSLFGKPKAKRPSRERFRAIVASAAGLSARSDLDLTTFAGVVFNPAEADFFDSIEKQVRELLYASEAGRGTRLEVKDDDLGTRWVVLDDRNLETLGEMVHMVGELITDHGFGDRLIAAVVRFDFERKPAYWIYNIKRGTFYPLVLSGDRERDNTAEIRLSTLMKEENVPVEPTLESWYALWGIPF